MNQLLLKKLKVMFFVLTIMMTTVVVEPCLAQPAQEESEESEEGLLSGAPKRQLSTIVYAGLAGAVLGLSTLSFYGRPQDHISNIAWGFATGIIIGAIFTTYKAATNPQDFYATRTDVHKLTFNMNDYFVPDSQSFKFQTNLYQLTF